MTFFNTIAEVAADELNIPLTQAYLDFCWKWCCDKHDVKEAKDFMDEWAIIKAARVYRRIALKNVK